VIYRGVGMQRKSASILKILGCYRDICCGKL